MILESFEIENWSCLKHIVVNDLPASGVIVLHGPNGTGKSSIVEALHACLMDFKSGSQAIGRGIPVTGEQKPRVSVVFRAQEKSWRICKGFGTKVGTKESKLESRMPDGTWKTETTDATEADDKTRQLAGGCKSEAGLYQLLWLTQAEFRLPKPSKFDGGVQSQLRNVLGVLQTPLDDRFLDRVKEGWSHWFHRRSKPGKAPTMKKDCTLKKALAQLEATKYYSAGI